jgi:hypothetical protein
VLDGDVDSDERRRGEVGRLDLATGERGGSLEGGVHGGATWPEGNGGEGWHPVVEVGGSRLRKVVRTRAVDRAASMERVSGRRRLVLVTPSWRKRAVV